MLPGDFIVTFDKAEVPNAEETILRIRRMNAGVKVGMTLIRKGEPVDLELTVAERPDATTLRLRSDIPKSGQEMAQALGITVRDLSEAERETLGLRPEHPAIIISDVAQGSQANQGGLKPGDLVHAVNQGLVRTSGDFYDLLGSLPKGRDSVLVLSRGGRRVDVYLNPGR